MGRKTKGKDRNKWLEECQFRERNAPIWDKSTARRMYTSSGQYKALDKNRKSASVSKSLIQRGRPETE